MCKLPRDSILLWGGNGIQERALLRLGGRKVELMYNVITQYSYSVIEGDDDMITKACKGASIELVSTSPIPWLTVNDKNDSKFSRADLFSCNNNKKV